jgi:hypothetical protein
MSKTTASAGKHLFSVAPNCDRSFAIWRSPSEVPPCEMIIAPPECNIHHVPTIHLTRLHQGR